MFFHLEKEGNPIICNTVMNLEDVMRGEISQTGKNKYHMIPLICGISNSLTHRSSVQRVVTGCSVRGQGNKRYWSKNTKLCKMNKS